MNFPGRSGKPKLLVGAPADVFDEPDSFDPRVEVAASSADAQGKSSQTLATFLEDDNSDMEADLMFINEEEDSPSKRFQLKTTFSLDQKVKKKRRRKQCDEQIPPGILLPLIEDSFSTHCAISQVNPNETESQSIENLACVWSSHTQNNNKQFFATFRDCLKCSVNQFAFFAYILKSLKEKSYLQIALFEECLLVFEKVLIDCKQSAGSVKLDTNSQQTLFDAIADLEFTPGVKKCINLYRLKDAIGNAFLFVIHRLLKEKKFKQLALHVNNLNLFAHIDLEKDLFMPLIAQNHLNVLETIAEGDENLQWDLIYFLDSVCSPRYRFIDALNEHYGGGSELGVPKIHYDKIRPQVLSKLTWRLMKKWNFDYERAPNVFTAHQLSQMDFYIRKRYEDSSGDKDNMDELLYSIACKNLSLKVELIRKCLHYNDRNMAVTWFLYFALDPRDLDDDVQDSITDYISRSDYVLQKLPFPDQVMPVTAGRESTSKLDHNAESEMANNALEMYYQLKQSESNIIIVDGFKMFMHAADRLLKQKDVRVVGLDCEWKPSFAKTSNQVALLQLATPDFVYLFDLMALEHKVEPSILKTFFQRLFTSRRITKLGFGFQSDLQALASYSFFSQCLENDFVRNMVDICELIAKVESSNPSFFPFSLLDAPMSFRAEKGLSSAVYKCLGKFLNKKEQLSDWERRPLRDAQIMYAAIDAACLLDIYAFIKHNMNNGTKTSTTTPGGTTTSKRSPKADSARGETEANGEGHQLVTTGSRRQRVVAEMFGEPTAAVKKRNGEPIECGDLKLVVDQMLEGIIRYMRMWGVDCVSPLYEDPDLAVDMAMKQRRILLTAGKNYNIAVKQLGPEQVVEVSTLVKAVDQAKFVFSHFNVTLDQSTLFTRCGLCNCDDYIIIPAPVTRAVISVVEGNPLDSCNLTENDLKVFREHFDAASGSILKSGHVPNFKAISPSVFEHDQDYFICVGCGKVYWEGGHYDRAMSTFFPSTSKSALTKQI